MLNEHLDLLGFDNGFQLGPLPAIKIVTDHFMVSDFIMTLSSGIVNTFNINYESHNFTKCRSGSNK